MKTKMIAVLAVMLCVTGFSQTNTDPPSLLSGPAIDAISFLSTGSNWMVAPYGIISADAKKFGGGIGIGYHVSDFVVPTMRLDYYDGRIWMPSGSLQIQAPITISKLTVIPFGFTGIATPLTGKASADGSPVGIFGIGGAVRIGTRWDVIADYEYWTGFPQKQIRLGAVFKF
jgi:hypothetical protein